MNVCADQFQHTSGSISLAFGSRAIRPRPRCQWNSPALTSASTEIPSRPQPWFIEQMTETSNVNNRDQACTRSHLIAGYPPLSGFPIAIKCPLRQALLLHIQPTLTYTSTFIYPHNSYILIHTYIPVSSNSNSESSRPRLRFSSFNILYGNSATGYLYSARM